MSPILPELPSGGSGKRYQSHTSMNVDSCVDRANFLRRGLIGRTAHVETSVVLVLKSSNRRDKRRSSDDRGLHLDGGLATDPILICMVPLKE